MNARYRTKNIVVEVIEEHPSAGVDGMFTVRCIGTRHRFDRLTRGTLDAYFEPVPAEGADDAAETKVNGVREILCAGEMESSGTAARRVVSERDSALSSYRSIKGTLDATRKVLGLKDGESLPDRARELVELPNVLANETRAILGALATEKAYAYQSLDHSQAKRIELERERDEARETTEMMRGSVLRITAARDSARAELAALKPFHETVLRERDHAQMVEVPAAMAERDEARLRAVSIESVWKCAHEALEAERDGYRSEANSHREQNKRLQLQYDAICKEATRLDPSIKGVTADGKMVRGGWTRPECVEIHGVPHPPAEARVALPRDAFDREAVRLYGVGIGRRLTLDRDETVLTVTTTKAIDAVEVNGRRWAETTTAEGDLGLCRKRIAELEQGSGESASKLTLALASAAEARYERDSNAGLLATALRERDAEIASGDASYASRTDTIRRLEAERDSTRAELEAKTAGAVVAFRARVLDAVGAWMRLTFTSDLVAAMMSNGLAAAIITALPLDEKEPVLAPAIPAGTCEAIVHALDATTARLHVWTDGMVPRGFVELTVPRTQLPPEARFVNAPLTLAIVPSPTGPYLGTIKLGVQR